MLDQPIEKRRLVGMELFAGGVDQKELRAIDFPARAARRAVGGSGAGKTVNGLAAFLVADRAELDERARLHAGLFARLAPRRVFERLVQVGQSLGNAPRLVAVIGAAWMHEQYFEACG